jgi:CubicO group peptidase (beta-lactamase class C family)
MIYGRKMTKAMFAHRGIKPWHFKKVAYFSMLLSIAAMSVGCASLDNSDSESLNLHEMLERLATKHGVCSVAVAVIKDRKLDSVDTAKGCMSASTLNSDSVFEAASLSKPVFAYAVLKLVQEGKLELDSPVMKYLPQGYQHQFHPFLPSSRTDLVTDPRLQAVTVRMALNHTSGLPNWAQGPLVFDFSPGEKWQYSGEGYILLQRAVEAVTNEKLDQFMSTQVFKPRAMNHSDYSWKPRLEKNIMPGTTRDGLPMKSWQFSAPVSAFSLYASAEDYGKFLATVLNDERLIKQIVDFPVTVNSSLNLSWGLGWGLERRDDDLFIWHWGNNPGYRAFVIASVRTGNGLVMLTNSEDGLTLAEPLTNKVLPGSHKVFRFHMLREGLANLLCETLNFCP